MSDWSDWLDSQDKIPPHHEDMSPAMMEAVYAIDLIGSTIENDDLPFAYILDADVHFESDNHTVINMTVDTEDGLKHVHLIMPTTLIQDDRLKNNRYVTSTVRYMILRGVNLYDRFKD